MHWTGAGAAPLIPAPGRQRECGLCGQRFRVSLVCTVSSGPAGLHSETLSPNKQINVTNYYRPNCSFPLITSPTGRVAQPHLSFAGLAASLRRAFAHKAVPAGARPSMTELSSPGAEDTMQLVHHCFLSTCISLCHDWSDGVLLSGSP